MGLSKPARPGRRGLCGPRGLLSLPARAVAVRELSVQGDSAALSSEPDCPTVAPSQSLSSCGPGVVVLASAALLPVPWMRSLLCLAFRDPYLDIGHPLIFQKPYFRSVHAGVWQARLYLRSPCPAGLPQRMPLLFFEPVS